MADLPRISKGQVEVVAAGDSAVRISRGQTEVVVSGSSAVRVSRAQVEVITLFDGPIPEPGGGGARAFAVWVNLGL